MRAGFSTWWLKQAFKQNPRWGKRDRHFIADSVWEVTRWKRALEFVSDSNDIRALLAAEWHHSGKEIPEWWHWNGAGVDEMTNRRGRLLDTPRAVRESYPDWLDSLAAESLGVKAWEAEASALTYEPQFISV